MQDLDRVCTALSLPDLQHLNEQVSKATSAQEAKTLFEEQVSVPHSLALFDVKPPMFRLASLSGSIPLIKARVY